MRFQTTVVPAQRDRDASKTGLACSWTRPKTAPFGNGTFRRWDRLTGGYWVRPGQVIRALDVFRKDGHEDIPTAMPYNADIPACRISDIPVGSAAPRLEAAQLFDGSAGLETGGMAGRKTCAPSGGSRTAYPVHYLDARPHPRCLSNWKGDDPSHDLGLAGARTSVQCDRTHEASLSRKHVQGFTLIELLSLLGAMGILVTVGISTATSIRTSARQVTCSGNLETIASAISRYTEETGHRPRSLSRLKESPAGTNLSNLLICPSDPAVRGTGRTRESQDLTWGNRANESQDPGIPSVVGEPESGSWQTELQERKETLPFSYLHPLGWTRSAWDRLRAEGSPFGTVVCQLHGVRVPSAPGNPDHRTYMEYEGRFLRAQTDGSVVRRKLFRDPDPQPGLVTTASPAPLDYPWEFYTDRNVPKLK